MIEQVFNSTLYSSRKFLIHSPPKKGLEFPGGTRAGRGRGRGGACKTEKSKEMSET